MAVRFYTSPYAKKKVDVPKNVYLDPVIDHIDAELQELLDAAASSQPQSVEAPEKALRDDFPHRGTIRMIRKARAEHRARIMLDAAGYRESEEGQNGAA